jgi:hypothetical protein
LTGFYFIANLALVDALAAFWFGLSIAIPDSHGWKDHTMIVEIHELAQERNVSDDVIKAQG